MFQNKEFCLKNLKTLAITFKRNASIQDTKHGELNAKKSKVQLICLWFSDNLHVLIF